MKALQFSIRILILLIVLGSLLQSQTITLRGSSAIELDLGFWNNVYAGEQSDLVGSRSEAKVSGFVGGLTYCYWMRENIAITVAGSLHSSEVSTTITDYSMTVEQHAIALFSLLVGMRYFIPEPDPEDMLRPYLAVAVGSFMGFEASSSLFRQSAQSESMFGGRAGIGLDGHLGKSVKFGVNAGYNVMSDFRSAIGARINFNGFDFSVGVALLFGGQR